MGQGIGRRIRKGLYICFCMIKCAAVSRVLDPSRLAPRLKSKSMTTVKRQEITHPRGFYPARCESFGHVLPLASPAARSSELDSSCGVLPEGWQAAGLSRSLVPVSASG